MALLFAFAVALVSALALAAAPVRASMEEGEPAPTRAGLEKEHARPRPAVAREAPDAMRPDFDAFAAAAAEQTVADRRWIYDPGEWVYPLYHPVLES
jgi:hypothetical protein